jgi:hypothetical protein
MKILDPATLVGARVQARYCEGDHCCEPGGEVRIYPILSVSRAARVILCHDCWEHENRYRHERGKELGCPEHWRTRDWDAAERCQPLRSAAETTAPLGIAFGQENPIRAPARAWRQIDQVGRFCAR